MKIIVFLEISRRIKDKFIYIDMKAANILSKLLFVTIYGQISRIINLRSKFIEFETWRVDCDSTGRLLDSLIQPGISIGAELTHSLLESIFFPEIHCIDGAVLG